jgi:hypothetical protein
VVWWTIPNGIEQLAWLSFRFESGAGENTARGLTVSSIGFYVSFGNDYLPVRLQLKVHTGKSVHIRTCSPQSRNKGGEGQSRKKTGYASEGGCWYAIRGISRAFGFAGYHE